MDKLKTLFDVLTRDGYYTKSFEEFQTQFQDSSYKDKVFNVVSRDGLFTKSKDDFLNMYQVTEVEPVKKKRSYGVHFGNWFFGFIRTS